MKLLLAISKSRKERIIKERFFLVAKEENVLEHFNYCREVFKIMICIKKRESPCWEMTQINTCQEYQMLWA